MRMRQLGKGHSVIFFTLGEVNRRIHELIPSGLASRNHIQVQDILWWAMHETCEEIRHYMPYWAMQGLDHHKCFAVYKQHSPTGNLDVMREAWLQPESQTLEEMYSVSPLGHGVISVPIRVTAKTFHGT